MELDVSAAASLSASLDGLARQLDAHRRQMARIAADCWYVQAPAVPIPVGSPFTVVPQQWGPSTGYCWAVQRVTYCPLGDNDNVGIYRGHGPGDVQPQNALNWLIPETGFINAATWHPGRVGLVLMPDESLVFAGSSSAGGAVSIDVIQVTSDNLPALLM